MNAIFSVLRSAISCALLHTLVLFGPGACSDPPTLDIPSDLGWTIEGEVRANWLFQADQSGGKLTQQAKVILMNRGGGSLSIEAVDWLGGNQHMNLQGPATGDWPVQLAGGEHLEYRVRYAPDDATIDQGEASLRIRHGGGEVTLRFGVEAKGAKACVNAHDLTFINPNPAAPPVQCVTVSNCGDVAFAVGQTSIAPASPFWQVMKAPDYGTLLAPMGGGESTAASTAEVCVRLAASGPSEDYGGTLLIDVDTPARKRLKVGLAVKWQIDNDFSLDCDGGQGRFDLEQAIAKTEAVCTLHNLGQAPLKVTAVELRAYHPDEQGALSAGFSVEARKPAGGGRLQGIFVVAAGNTRELVVTGPLQAGITPVACRVHANRFGGLVVIHPGSAASLQNVLVDGNLPREHDQVGGVGVAAQDGAELSLRGVRLSGNYLSGLTVSSNKTDNANKTLARAVGLLIDDTGWSATLIGEKVVGNAAMALSAARGAQVHIAGSRLSDNLQTGIWAAWPGTHLRATGVTIDNQRNTAKGKFGAGLVATGQAELELRACLASDNRGAGLYISHCSGLVEGMLIRSTLASEFAKDREQGADLPLADGILVSQTPALSLSRSLVSGSARVGVLVHEAPGAKLQGMVATGSPYGLVIEGHTAPLAADNAWYGNKIQNQASELGLTVPEAPEAVDAPEFD